jgi:hypothetical protein
MTRRFPYMCAAAAGALAVVAALAIPAVADSPTIPFKGRRRMCCRSWATQALARMRPERFTWPLAPRAAPRERVRAE